jgi:hypothetical protein
MRGKQKEIWFNYTKRPKTINVRGLENPKPILPIINENNKVGTQLTNGYKKVLSSIDFFKKI